MLGKKSIHRTKVLDSSVVSIVEDGEGEVAPGGQACHHVSSYLLIVMFIVERRTSKRRLMRVPPRHRTCGDEDCP
jgi:hypothetical protein